MDAPTRCRDERCACVQQDDQHRKTFPRQRLRSLTEPTAAPALALYWDVCADGAQPLSKCA
eukprot:scaffold56491_cov75-Phaeocystis_antarctica.AAC.5